MRIALGCDHGGYRLKEIIKNRLTELGIEYEDFGSVSEEPTDYAIYARAAAEAVAKGDCQRGIVICTTGVGVSIVANKVKGVRCALCTDTYTSRLTRLHNDANVLALGSGIVGDKLATEIVEAFLDTDFSNEERHIRRINMIE